MRTTGTRCPLCGEVGDHAQLETRPEDDFFTYCCPHCGGHHDLNEEVFHDHEGNIQTNCAACGGKLSGDLYRQTMGWDSRRNAPAWVLVHKDCYED